MIEERIYIPAFCKFEQTISGNGFDMERILGEEGVRKSCVPHEEMIGHKIR